MSFLRFLRDNRAFLFVGFLLSFTSSYGQTYFISIFAGEIRGEFGLSNGAWGAIYTAGTTLSAIAMIWAGTLTDRFRVRQLGAVILGLLALACLAMAAVPSAIALVFVIFALRFLGQGMSSQLAIVSMARWFVATRGRALSIASMGFSMGQAVLPLLFVALMASIHWRTLWIAAAFLVLLTIPPVVALLKLERTPQSIAKDDQVAGLEGRHWTRGEVLRHPLCWLVLPAMVGPPAWNTALFFHQVHLTEVKGWALVDFVALMPLFTVVAIAATFTAGWAVDRFGSGKVMMVYMVPMAAAFLVLAAAPTIGVAAIGMALLGLSQGMQATVPGAFWAEHFGTRHLGAIKAAAAAAMVFGSAIGPGLSGLIIDLGTDFPQQMYAYGLFYAVAGVLAVWGVRRKAQGLPAAA